MKTKSITMLPHIPNIPPKDFFKTQPVVVVPTTRSRQPIEVVAQQKAEKKMTGTELKAYKQTLTLTPRLKEIMCGNMLGDASLQTQSQGKTYRLKYQYGEVNMCYAVFIHQELNGWVLSPPKSYTRPSPVLTTGVPVENRSVTTVGFQTISHEKLGVLAEMFLNEQGKKVIKPQFVKNYLTPTTVAIWYMDDGGKMDYGGEGKGVVFNTQGFSEQEVTFLCEGLESNFQLKCWPKANKKKSVIAVSGKSYETFRDLVWPELEKVPTMQHKLPSVRKTKS